MSQIFHRSANTIARVSIFGAIFFVAALLVLAAEVNRSPWVTDTDIRTRGGILLWPTSDTGGTPPAVLRERFPDLVPEVPRAFERPLQGRLGLLRIGWALIRPLGQPVDLAPPEPATPPP